MSNLADTSLQAFRTVDVTAGQARILAAFRHGVAITRQELVTLTGLQINSVSGRCAELLEAGKLESLPAVDGRHPLRLKEQTQRGLHGSVVSGEQYPHIADGRRERDEEGTAVSRVAPETRSFTKSARYVRPAIFGRMSMSLDSAKQIAKDPGNHFINEARAVVAAGKPYWMET